MARLAVGADGRRSACRAAAGIETESSSYPQAALTVTLRHSRPHHDISTEFHRPSGPLTLVPLPGQRSSLVFVSDPDEAALFIGRYGKPLQSEGVRTLLNRVKKDSGIEGVRVSAHTFRHTFATVATQLGWNFERLRAAMGHADYNILQRYVRLATERDLGSLREWTELVVESPRASR